MNGACIALISLLLLFSKLYTFLLSNNKTTNCSVFTSNFDYTYSLLTYTLPHLLGLIPKFIELSIERLKNNVKK